NLAIHLSDRHAGRVTTVLQIGCRMIVLVDRACVRNPRAEHHHTEEDGDDGESSAVGSHHGFHCICPTRAATTVVRLDVLDQSNSTSQELVADGGDSVW